VTPPVANAPAAAPGTPATRAAGASDLPAVAGLEGSSAGALPADTVPGARPGATLPGGDGASATSLPPANAPASSGGTPAHAGIASSAPASAAAMASGADPTSAAATAQPTPGSPAPGEALPGASAESIPAGPGDIPKTPHDQLGVRGRAGSDSGWVGSGSTKGAAPPPGSSAPAAGATLGSITHTQGASAGGESWSSQADGRQPGERQGPPSGDGAGARDKLRAPDPAQAPMGADANTGALAAEAVGGLAEGPGFVQTSAAAGGDPQGPLLDSGVGLQQAIETLHGTIQLVARRGLSQARIALEPEGLGEIRIHLTQTTQGLLARVTAETPAAAQALAAAHAELRQSLDSLGLNLARLNVGRHGHSADQGGSTALGGGGHGGASGRGEASDRGDRSGQRAAIAAPTDSTADSELESAEDAQPALAPSHGTLVDVLA
ncbi:MAG: flagellar hook-length control protein FliK, partial [Solirubrobacteraceae bacterium]